MPPPHLCAGGFVCADCKEVGQGGESHGSPREIRNRLPEAAPAVVTMLRLVPGEDPGWSWVMFSKLLF